MKRMNLRKIILPAVILSGLVFAEIGLAHELEPIPLPEPQMTGGKPLMEALRARQTTRQIDGNEIPLQTLSNLLWAAFGVNREAGPGGKPGRTAPSAFNRQEIQIYVAISKGVFVYDAVGNKLNPVSDKDVRGLTGHKRGDVKAPIHLIYVENTAAGAKGPSFGEVDTGFIGQNVYLFCASEMLACWFFYPDRKGLVKPLKLNRSQRVLYAQAVGRFVEK